MTILQEILKEFDTKLSSFELDVLEVGEYQTFVYEDDARKLLLSSIRKVVEGCPINRSASDVSAIDTIRWKSNILKEIDEYAHTTTTMC